MNRHKLMKWRAVLLAAFMLFVLAEGLFPKALSAHAFIKKSNPQAESELKQSPGEIRITFTEKIDTKLSDATLLTDQGDAIDADQTTEDDETIVLKPPALKDGVYKVKWQVLSVDTHVTEGSFRFSVGVPLKANRPHETISLDDDQGSNATGPASQGSAPVKPTKPTKTSSGSAVPSGGKEASKPEKDKADPSRAADPTSQGNESKITSGSPSSSPSPAKSAEGQGKNVKPKENDRAADTASGSTESEGGIALPGETKGGSPAEAEASSLPSSKATQSGDGVQGGASDGGGISGGSSELKATESFTPRDTSSASSQAEDIHLHHHDHQAVDSSGFPFAAWLSGLRILDILVFVCLGGLVYFRDVLMGRQTELAAYEVKAKTERSVTIAAVLVLLVSGCVHLMLLLMQLSPTHSLDAAAWGKAPVVLGSTMVGAAMWIRPLLAILLLSMVLRGKPGESQNVSAFAAKGVILAVMAVTFPMTGHAFSGEGLRILTIVSHLLHLAMAAVWFGGLAGLVLLTFRVPKELNLIQPLHKLVQRFSGLALFLVAAVVVTGVFLSVMRIGSWSALVESSYGQILLWKIGFFIAAGVFAAVQRLVLLPRLQNTDTSQASILLSKWKFSIRTELLFAIIVFIVAGLLSTTSPPSP